MRTVMIFIVMSSVSSLLSQGQSIPINESPAPERTYHLLREDDHWSFLADSVERQDFWDPIKYIPLRSDRDGWFLSMGGEAREMWEQIGNDNWGQQPFMNGYFDERYMFYFDVQYGTDFRSFVELKSGLNSYRIGGPRPIDEKKLDFQAAFFEVGTGDDRNWIKFRAGRQEMEYGSGRLIDVREGPNVRLSFDGFKVKTGIGRWQIDGFAMRPDLDKPGFFDNAPNHSVGFWGVYGVRPLKKSLCWQISPDKSIILICLRAPRTASSPRKQRANSNSSRRVPPSESPRAGQPTHGRCGWVNRGVGSISEGLLAKNRGFTH
jgi:Alginate export